MYAFQSESTLYSCLNIKEDLGMILDSNLSYEYHNKSILNKVNKTNGLLPKFQLILPRHSLNNL